MPESLAFASLMKNTYALKTSGLNAVKRDIVSLFILPNVQAHPPLGARENVERGVEVVVIMNAWKQGGS